MCTLAICTIFNGYTQVNIKILLIQTYHTTCVSFSCEFIIFHVNRPIHPPLNMAQQVINEITSHKHLGLVFSMFSNDCNWHEHIDYIKTKAWFRINIMRKLTFQLDRKSLETIYISFIRPLLEYANVVVCRGQLHSVRVR